MCIRYRAQAGLLIYGGSLSGPRRKIATLSAQVVVVRLILPDGEGPAGVKRALDVPVPEIALTRTGNRPTVFTHHTAPRWPARQGLWSLVDMKQQGIRH